MSQVPQRSTYGRTLYKFSGGYWFIILTPAEREEYPGCTWSGYVLYHKWAWWKKYGEWYGRDTATYRYLDGDKDNIRITNIGVKAIRCQEWF